MKLDNENAAQWPLPLQEADLCEEPTGMTVQSHFDNHRVNILFTQYLLFAHVSGISDVVGRNHNPKPCENSDGFTTVNVCLTSLPHSSSELCSGASDI
jgi:hypothetical protein